MVMVIFIVPRPDKHAQFNEPHTTAFSTEQQQRQTLEKLKVQKNVK